MRGGVGGGLAEAGNVGVSSGSAEPLVGIFFDAPSWGLAFLGTGQRPGIGVVKGPVVPPLTFARRVIVP